MSLFLATSIGIISLFWALSMIMNIQEIGIDGNENQNQNQEVIMPMYF